MGWILFLVVKVDLRTGHVSSVLPFYGQVWPQPRLRLVLTQTIPAPLLGLQYAADGWLRPGVVAVWYNHHFVPRLDLGWLYQTATTPGRRESWKNEAKKSFSPKVERKVAGSILEGAVAISNRVKVEFLCAYSCLMCNCESVICLEFSLQKYRPRGNI